MMGGEWKGEKERYMNMLLEYGDRSRKVEAVSFWGVVVVGVGIRI